jgi:hypothetical protein
MVKNNFFILSGFLFVYQSVLFSVLVCRAVVPRQPLIVMAAQAAATV